MALKAAELAIKSIGLGYDISADLRLKYCKSGSADPYLIELDDDQVQDVVLPGGVLIPSVSTSIKCDKGERMRFASDVLSFQQMSEQINQELSLSGKIPSGMFNTMFEFSGCWQKDAANTKSLAFDGWFITLYTVALAKSQIVLRDHVKSDVPSSWDPAALASFIQRYGTHIVVGVKMGGRDVVYAKQQHLSNVQPADVQRRLKEMADKRFLDGTAQCGADSDEAYVKDKPDAKEIRLRFAASSPFRSYPSKDDIICIYNRRGGSKDKNVTHYEWLDTVQSEPDVISMAFIPITSLLNGVLGSGFLIHAINLYLRYKPPIEELHQFLEFQLPRQWAPVFGELPLGLQHKQRSRASLQLGLFGPKLHINTMPIDVGKRPVTGLRLYLEGKKSNRLAIHLQHLSAIPKSFHLCEDPGGNFPREPDFKFFERVQRRRFCHVCTAPVESYDDLAIVTGAQLRVRSYGCKRILFLHLHFSRVSNAVVVKQPQWDGTPGQTQKSGIMSMLISGHFTTAQKQPPVPAEVNINSAVFPGGPPGPTQPPKLLKFVNTTEMCRGPENTPGYWVVSGARLIVEKGKISLKVKYTLLTALLPDDEMQGESTC